MILSPLALMMALTAHPPSAIPKPKPIKLSGAVREVSGSPGGRALLVLDDGAEFVLHGPNPGRKNELKRLSGTRVRVFGVTRDPRIPRGRHIMVERYQILDVGGGTKPRVGTLASLKVAGQDRLIFVDQQGQADMLPAGWGKKMNKHAGAKVWMVGRRASDGFKPQRFAILRPGRKADSGGKANSNGKAE